MNLKGHRPLSLWKAAFTRKSTSWPARARDASLRSTLQRLHRLIGAAPGGQRAAREQCRDALGEALRELVEDVIALASAAEDVLQQVRQLQASGCRGKEHPQSSDRLLTAWGVGYKFADIGEGERAAG